MQRFETFKAKDCVANLGKPTLSIVENFCQKKYRKTSGEPEKVIDSNRKRLQKKMREQ